MFKAYAKYWKNFADFSGRTRRKDYWLALIATAIISGVLGVVLSLTGNASVDPTTGLTTYNALGSAITSIWSLVNLVPGLAICVRRMHDVDKRGWFLLWELVPIVGAIVVFIKNVTAGTKGDNRFGKDPKSDVAAIEG